VETRRAVFTFVEGHLTFAAPVAGRVLAAVFEGRGRIKIKVPTEAEQHQLARFTQTPKLTDEFKQAVFFFTDDSWTQLQQLVQVSGGASANAANQALAAAQRKHSEKFNDWREKESVQDADAGLWHHFRPVTPPGVPDHPGVKRNPWADAPPRSPRKGDPRRVS
jgi:hypothetical protein